VSCSRPNVFTIPLSVGAVSYGVYEVTVVVIDAQLIGQAFALLHGVVCVQSACYALVRVLIPQNVQRESQLLTLVLVQFVQLLHLNGPGSSLNRFFLIR
jgi:hypothetical protein